MSKDERAALVERWCRLTCKTMPAMAAAENWPIALDHCFMRVCLDSAMGVPWTDVVARPAVRRATDEQLRAAIAVAEGIVAAPSSLFALNAASIAGRRAATRAA